MGMACTGAGAVFMVLGVLLFFNASLLALGNVSPLAAPVKAWKPTEDAPTRSVQWRTTWLTRF